MPVAHEAAQNHVVAGGRAGAVARVGVAGVGVAANAGSSYNCMEGSTPWAGG